MDTLNRPKGPELIQPGQSFGKFYLVQIIGEGGTSRIFKALQQPINRLVALKIPSFSESGSVLTPDEFLSEATLMAKLEHPNVVRIYDFGVSEDRAFICMEYVEGLNLLERIRTQHALSLSATLALGLQTLDALLHSHAQDVLHLDLSPANVLIAKTGLVKLLDFGMAGKKHPTGQGKVFGTPAFLSPEHVKGKTGTRQSDLFSFGSLLYFAATADQLFDPGPENEHIPAMLRAIELAREHPPESKLKILPPSLARIIKLALTGSPADEISKALKETWTQLEGDNSPSSVLGSGTQNPGESANSGEELPMGEKLRVLYLQLRDSGRHREAVNLMEKAIRREPENKALVELLATPPIRPKAIPATMEVAASVNKTKAISKAEHKPTEKKALPFILGFLVLAMAGYLVWDALNRPDRQPPTALEKTALAKPQTAAGLAKESVIAKDRVISKDSVIPKDLAIPKDEAIPKTPALTAQSTRAPKTPKKTRLRPALAIAGPAGIKVSLDDSIEWVSPSPVGGWPLNPGLINLTLTLPGSQRPITSSLYISTDSLYLIHVDSDGGFSVARQPR